MLRPSLSLLAIALAASEPAPADRIFLAPAPATAPSWTSHQFVRLPKIGDTASLDLRLDGKPILLQRSERGIIIDRNRDGACTDADLPEIEPLGSIDLPWTFAGRACTYKLRLERLDKSYAILASATELIGRWKNRTIRLIDANVNGSFADLGQDRIQIQEAQAAPRPHGWNIPTENPELRPLLYQAGSWWSVAMNPDGRSLDIAAYSGAVATITIAAVNQPVEGGSLTLLHSHPEASITIEAGKSQTVPAGDWKITSGNLRILGPSAGKLTGGTSTYLWCSNTKNRISAAAGATVDLVIDAPDRIDFNAWKPASDRLEIESFNLRSPTGLEWQAPGGEDGKITTWLVASGLPDRRNGVLERG